MFGLVRTILLHRKPLKSTLLECNSVERCSGPLGELRNKGTKIITPEAVQKESLSPLFGLYCTNINNCYERFVIHYLTGELWTR